MEIEKKTEKKNIVALNRGLCTRLKKCLGGRNATKSTCIMQLGQFIFFLYQKSHLGRLRQNSGFLDFSKSQMNLEHTFSLDNI